MKTERDIYMDNLVLRVGNVLDGEELDDVILACCAIISHAVGEMPMGKRCTMLKLTFEFLTNLTQENENASSTH